MKEYQIQNSNIYYDCPVGVTINGVTRETIKITTDDWTCEDGTIDVYPTTQEGIAFVSYYGEVDCPDGYISETKIINIKNLYNYINEFTDTSPEDIDSENLRALET